MRHHWLHHLNTTELIAVTGPLSWPQPFTDESHYPKDSNPADMMTILLGTPKPAAVSTAAAAA